jgi:RNA polymerase sigma-70 factor (ECF subfamily)
MAGRDRETEQRDSALKDGARSAASVEGDRLDLETCLARIAAYRDRSAYAALFRLIAPKVKAYLIRGGADAATAEELAQETLARIWAKAGLYRPGVGNPEGWVLAMARNLRIDRLRKERVWELSNPLPEDHDAGPSEEPSADERVDAREREQRVREALADLPPEQREVITLSFVDGLSHSAVAKRLDLSLGTVKSRLRLAYEKMRPVLTELR